MNITEFRKIVSIRSGQAMGVKKFDGVRYIRITDIQKYNMLGNDAVSATGNINTLIDGDILFPRTGTNWIPFLYRSDIGAACFASYLFAIHSKELPPEYIYFQMCSPRFQSWINLNRRDRNITMKDLGNYPFIINDMEQTKILLLSERLINKQILQLRNMENRYKLILRKLYFENTNTVIGNLCRKIASTRSCEKGNTPVIGIDGVCGYSKEPGLIRDMLGIQKNGNFAKITRIPGGALCSTNLECVEPLIDIQHLQYILEGAELSNYVLRGPVPHLYFKNIQNIACRYDEGNTNIPHLLKKQMNLQLQKLELLKMRHNSLLEAYFPSQF